MTYGRRLRTQSDVEPQRNEYNLRFSEPYHRPERQRLVPRPVRVERSPDRRERHRRCAHGQRRAARNSQRRNGPREQRRQLVLKTTPNDLWTQIANPNPAPVVSTITTSPGSGDLTVGATVTLTVTFNSAVTVAGGTPTLALNDGGVATYVSGSGSSALVFKYTVAAGQNIADLTSAASSAITLNGATIRGTSGSNAVLTGANGYNPAGILQIDTTAPTLSAIAELPGSGQVATGGTVTLTATFSEAVTVAGGTPTLALNDGVAPPLTCRAQAAARWRSNTPSPRGKALPT